MITTVEELDAALLRAVEKARQSGFRIVPTDRRSGRLECCPLGALIDPNGPSLNRFPTSYECEDFGYVKRSLARGFAAGFDGEAFIPSTANTHAFELGRKWRKECERKAP